MTATNEILEFAEEATNILSQAQYVANEQLADGLSGFTDDKIMNKILKQATLIAASVAQFIADNQVSDVVDTLPISTLVTMLTNAMVAAVTGSSAFASSSQETNLGNGKILKWGTAILSAGETNVAFPTQFPTSCFSVIGNDNTSNAYAIGTYTFSHLGFKAIAKDIAGLAVATTIAWHAIGE